MNPIIRLALPLLIPAALAGCAGVPRDAGFDEVRRQVAERLGERIAWRQGGAGDAAVDAEVRAALAAPLTADAAVRVALLNNRALQAEYEELGVAQADLVQAGLLQNPVFGWSRQEGGDVAKTTWGVELDFLGLLLRAPRKTLEGLRFEHARLRVAQAVLRHAAETRKAWFAALAAEQDAGFLAQVAELTAVEAELGERQRRAGNLNRRDALRQQVFAEESAAALARAREAAFAARERLNRLMGVWGADTGWQLPPRLPEPPAAQPVFEAIEAYGLRQRLDVRMAQKEAEAMAAGLGLTRDTRFINVLDLGVETEKASGERRITGPTLRLELPLFDQGQARVSKQEARYRQSEARLYALAVDARSEMREAYQRAATARAGRAPCARPAAAAPAADRRGEHAALQRHADRRVRAAGRRARAGPRGAGPYCRHARLLARAGRPAAGGGRQAARTVRARGGRCGTHQPRGTRGARSGALRVFSVFSVAKQGIRS